MSGEEQFLRAFDVYSDALFRHSFFRLSDREKALDLVQDTFTKAWDYARQGRKIDNYRPFLYKILNNLIIDEYRKSKSVSLDALLEDDHVSVGDFDELRDESASRWADQIDGEKVLAEVKDLPEPYREAVILRYVDGLTPKEIAGLIEESENVVSVRIHRGLRQVRKKLENHGAIE